MNRYRGVAPHRRSGCRVGCPRASARDEVLVCDVAETSQVDGRVVAVLNAGDQDARVSGDGSDGIVSGGASSDDGPRHDGVIFDGNVCVARQGGARSLVVSADDVFRRGVSGKLHMGVPSQRAGLEVGAPFIGDTSGDDAECSSADVHPDVPPVVEVAGRQLLPAVVYPVQVDFGSAGVGDLIDFVPAGRQGPVQISQADVGRSPLPKSQRKGVLDRFFQFPSFSRRYPRHAGYRLAFYYQRAAFYSILPCL